MYPKQNCAKCEEDEEETGLEIDCEARGCEHFEREISAAQFFAYKFFQRDKRLGRDLHLMLYRYELTVDQAFDLGENLMIIQEAYEQAQEEAEIKAMREARGIK